MDLPKFSILVVEDDSTTRLAYAELFKHDDDLKQHPIVFASTLREAWVKFHKMEGLVFVLVDLHLKNDPNGDGLDLAYYVKRHSPESALVYMVTGDTSDATQIEMAKKGVDKFFGKPISPTSFLQWVKSGWQQFALRRDVAGTDKMTGLWNLAFFEENTQGVFRDAGREGRTDLGDFSLLSIDIDHFKLFNDTYGHPTGDQVIQRVADVIHGARRASDLACRSGGDEFLLLLPGADSLEAHDVGKRIQGEVQKISIPGAGGSIKVRFSVSYGVGHMTRKQVTESLNPLQELRELADNSGEGLNNRRHAERHPLVTKEGGD